MLTSIFKNSYLFKLDYNGMEFISEAQVNEKAIL